MYAQTVLQNPISASATTINVYCAASFPDPTVNNFYMQIESEQMLVTGATLQTNGTTNWTVVRGQQSTAAVGHSSGKLVTIVSPAMTAAQTMLTVGNTTGFPVAFPFDVQVDAEIMQVTGYAVTNSDGTHTNLDGTTTWNVLRGQAGTTPTTHDANTSQVSYSSVRALALNSYFNAAIDALFTKYLNPATPADKLQVSLSGTIYEGEVVPVTSGGPYVLRFNTAGDLTNYDVYYPFFKGAEGNQYFWAGYTPALTPAAPPSWMDGAGVSSMSPSTMVFSCNGVFADNTFQPLLNLTEQTTLGTLENMVVSASIGGWPNWPATQPMARTRGRTPLTITEPRRTRPARCGIIMPSSCTRTR